MRTHLRDIVALVALAAVAFAVGGVILSKQRFHLPAGIPVLGKDFVELQARFTTAQAVTPGQGQTVNVAGITVGEVSGVRLERGQAVVTLSVEQRYAPLIRADATMLLRPKTGLNDMVVDVSPGSRTRPPVTDGQTIPVANTEPNVNVDEILATLDTETRDYLKLLLVAGGDGIGGNERALSATLRRFDPTARDVRRITGLLSRRGGNLRRVVHSFRKLAVELAGKDRELGDFVSSSDAVLASFAGRERRIREALAELPGALGETDRALRSAGRLARRLRPALSKLRPGARAFAPALRATRPFVRETVEPIREQIRPFTRAAIPTLATLRPAAEDLSAATPGLLTSFKVLNRALNTLAYNPPGEASEGYLFWLAWANHLGNAIFANGDAHGPLRHGMLVLSCQTAGVLETVKEANESLATLTELANPPTDAEICPSSGASK